MAARAQPALAPVAAAEEPQPRRRWPTSLSTCHPLAGRRRRWRWRWGSSSSIGDDIAVALAIILAVGVFILLFLLIATVIFPLIVLGLELMLLLVLLLGGLTGRLLFRRPWTVRARAADGRIMRWHVRGFRRSGGVRNEIAAALAAGQGEPVLAGATRLPDAGTPAVAAAAQPIGPPPTMRA